MLFPFREPKTAPQSRPLNRRSSRIPALLWMLHVPGKPDRQSGNIDHTSESVDVWAVELRLRFAGQPVAVALEQSRGPLVFMLAKYDHLVVFPIHPTMLANYRKSFRPSGAKDDPSDAGLLLDVLTLHRNKLRRLNPDTPETRTLQFLPSAGGTGRFRQRRGRQDGRDSAHLHCFVQTQRSRAVRLVSRRALAHRRSPRHQNCGITAS